MSPWLELDLGSTEEDTIRIKYAKPVETAQGKVTSSRTIGMFDCEKKQSAGKESIQYIDEAAGRVARRDVMKIPGYGVAFKGTAADVAMHYQGMLHSDVWSRRAVTEGIRCRVREPAYGPVEHGGTDHPISMGLFVTLRGDAWQVRVPDTLRIGPALGTVIGSNVAAALILGATRWLIG